MKNYRATAHREGRYWLVDVKGVGVTQGRNLAEARIMAVDLVVAMTELEPNEFELDFQPELPEDLVLEVEHARQAVVRAEREQREAALLSRGVVAALKGRGLTGKDIAVVLGVSEQRVSQLAAARVGTATHS